MSIGNIYTTSEVFDQLGNDRTDEVAHLVQEQVNAAEDGATIVSKQTLRED